MFRRSVLIAAGGMYRRLQRVLTAYPWRLVVLGDHRITDGSRRSLCQDFMSRSPCCLPAGMARKLRHRFQCPEEMRTPAMQRLWLALGRCITMTIAEIENRHARNNKRSHALSSWTRFCSTYVAQEAIILQRARHGLRRLLSASGTRPTQALPSAVSPSRQPTLDHVMDVQRRQTGFEMFRREFLAQERLLGRTHKVASADFWVLVNAKWAALADSARMEYCQNGEDTAPVALCNRMLVRSRGRTAGESPGPEAELASTAAAHAAVSQHDHAGGPPLSVTGWLEATTPLPQVQPAEGSQQALVPVAAQMLVPPPCMNVDGEDLIPLSSMHVRAYKSGAGRSETRAHEMFEHYAQSRAAPKEHSERFPDKVSYSSC